MPRNDSDPLSTAPPDAEALDPEARLISALRARPQPPRISNLAHLAMEKAGRVALARQAGRRRATPRLSAVARHRRWNAGMGLAAGVLIALVLLSGVLRLSRRGTATDTGGTTGLWAWVADAGDDQGQSDAGSSTSQSSGYARGVLILLAAELLVVGIALLHSGSPLAPAAPFFLTPQYAPSFRKGTEA